ncbi:SDR family oxidoreductase [Paramixta manurensis]|uniref:SDR family oxidoreductase n=1 Tax=Paramixta manurensis TaxID=2740817 RepID=A0A6M8UCP7_9GAMM|nr:SDR family oxidoreductase [Erwiniaceae bacterium PD-1]
MRVFLTGASGFIGSHIVPELIAAGHQVIGLARSEASAEALKRVGVEVHRGTLEDPSGLSAGAAKADAVIHTAFDHDFSNFVANCEKDRRVIKALAAELKGSARPLLITSGTGIGDAGNGQPAREDLFDVNHPNPRIASELEGNIALQQGIDVRVIRLPQVHNTVKQGLVSPFIEISWQKGQVAWVNEGRNRWPAAHVLDVAALYRLALDHGRTGARYNAVAEEGVAVKDIAQVIGAGLDLPLVSLSAQQASQHFGWLALFADKDLPASATWTRQQLGWTPGGPGLLEDLKNMDYSAIKNLRRD